MDGRSTGLIIVGLGIAAVVVGLLIYAGALSWFGRLPGDIRIEGENVRFYLPITSMVLASVVVTIVVNLIRKFF